MARTYNSELREQQAAMTRERIVEATWELLRTTRPVDLSYAAVAERAGVSKRTVYRHYPTPDDLFAAVADQAMTSLFDASMAEVDARGAIRLLQRQLEVMESDRAVFRAFFALPMRSRQGGEGFVERVLAHRVEHLGPEQRRLALGLIDLLSSPYAWDVLHSNWGLDSEQALRALLAGMHAILAYAEAHPDHLDPEGPDLTELEI